MEDEVRECRYGCGQTVTHWCLECAKSYMSGYFCAEHAERHNSVVLEHFKDLGVDDKHAMLANPIKEVWG